MLWRIFALCIIDVVLVTAVLAHPEAWVYGWLAFVCTAFLIDTGAKSLPLSWSARLTRTYRCLRTNPNAMTTTELQINALQYFLVAIALGCLAYPMMISAALASHEILLFVMIVALIGSAFTCALGVYLLLRALWRVVRKT